MDMNHTVDVQHEVRMSQEDLDDLIGAKWIVDHSDVLKGKRVVGKFLGFNQNVPGNKEMVVFDENRTFVLVQTADVRVITPSGCVIAN